MFYRGGISQKLICMLCRLKRYNLILQESQGKRGILQFPLAISVKYVFSEATEGFVETEEKLTPNILPRLCQTIISRRQYLQRFLTLKWRFGLLVTFLLSSGSSLASKYMHQRNFLWFFKARSSVFQHHRSVSWKLFRCVRCPIQLQELLTRSVS